MASNANAAGQSPRNWIWKLDPGSQNWIWKQPKNIKWLTDADPELNDGEEKPDAEPQLQRGGDADP